MDLLWLFVLAYLLSNHRGVPPFLFFNGGHALVQCLLLFIGSPWFWHHKYVKFSFTIVPTMIFLSPTKPYKIELLTSLASIGMTYICSFENVALSCLCSLIWKYPLPFWNWPNIKFLNCVKIWFFLCNTCSWWLKYIMATILHTKLGKHWNQIHCPRIFCWATLN